MPQLIPLEPIPQQSFSIRLENRRYDVKIRFTSNVMTGDVVRDGVTIIQGIICTAEGPLLPYRYMEDESGNFFWQTENEELPDYTLFGDTHLLYYFTNAELQEIRDGV